jgi:hypothetical protein
MDLLRWFQKTNICKLLIAPQAFQTKAGLIGVTIGDVDRADLVVLLARILMPSV